MTQQSPEALIDPNRAPTLAGVERAAAKVAALLPQTPLLPLEVDGQTVWCKAECLQPIGSFKIRGGWHRMSDLTPEEAAAGVVGVSSGNHAQGVAWAAKRLGIRATIVMPSNAPAMKLAATRRLGAEVVLYDRVTESRDVVAAKLLRERGGTLVHAYGDPWIIEGQGSVGIEAKAQMQARGIDGPDKVIACCGGGGLSAGLALALPDAEIVAVEPEGWDDVTRSLAAGEILSVEDLAYPTECDALQTPQTWPINFAVLEARGVRGVVVTRSEVRDAVRLAFEKLHLAVEPGGAAALAAVVAGKVAVTDATLVTLSGGNVDPLKFAEIITE
ncbi:MULTISPECIES: pyridoxal-phosphate dependent enzyme [unclassified Sphingopyxis]|uniref:threonine ammonia-lyase n=1 Tax=unclassified Sphingopyxis TaxID=2614943 RepID=UPI0007300EC1|nr:MULTISPECIES: pyridoxal-phosphate dependent enzyme [unclassified Sphingopyxis]KTE25398.1 pyridoxal-5'-phosphate-dependent protein [Sphingopyxis sp. H057]KTE53419.1 pyridoxal-5'-phosphate-dependent protein [Sphingopyxis sp. H073]KTE56009.1 pyridoxal-5'-phosphate-dependent protein [Sphingopyxis sp. H071]KTE62876.1 pyridoxal-5'-phosphate-dependent protein [Sphingopyxis sp. H107]KTE66977.1 pyridoxal-5'-phosphate-dependent protein [Sphingopyxis sp. H100]